MLRVNSAARRSNANAIMVPTSTSTNPTLPRPIVPAIPLPYIQKRKQQQAAREKEAEGAVRAAQAPIIEAPPATPTPPPADSSTPVVNGSTETFATDKTAEINEPAKVESFTAPAVEVEEEAVDQSANGDTHAVVEVATGKQHL